MAADEVVIAVMGATGSGKSSFINMVSGSELAVGNGLKSCTAIVSHSQSFELFDRRVTLIDTPGFDDTLISDTDILKMIALYLSTTYEQGFKLSGIIYMHRISDFRMGGTSRRNFNMFRKLCGDDVLHNVVIVTTMWGEVDVQRGAARERELASDDLLFKPVLDLGARMVRYAHSNTASAQATLIYLVKNHPEALRIQRELVDEGKDIADTDAGRELQRELTELAKKHREQLAAVQKELQEALKTKDLESSKELEGVRKELAEKIAQAENDRARLSVEFAEEKRQTEEKIAELTGSLNEERLHREHRERELVQLSSEMDQNERTAAAGRAQLGAELDNLLHQREGNIFATIGDVLDLVVGIAKAWVAASIIL